MPKGTSAGRSVSSGAKGSRGTAANRSVGQKTRGASTVASKSTAKKSGR